MRDAAAVEVLGRLAAAVDVLAARQPRVLVAIDGPDAAGKTTLADALAGLVKATVTRASIDDFQQSAAVRYRDGELSPDGYYLDGFDHATLAETLLAPFGGGAAVVSTASFDLDRDRPAQVTTQVTPRGVLIVDGVFLQRPSLRDLWSLVVYLRVSPEVTLERGVERDAHESGQAERDAVTERYTARYLPGQERYRREVDPERLADIVIDNTDPARPEVVRWLQ